MLLVLLSSKISKLFKSSEDLKSLEILNDKKTSNLKRQDIGTSGHEFTENFDCKRLKLGNDQELRRGVSSIIAKLRQDMGSDDCEFTEDNFDISCRNIKIIFSDL
jgi:hypothetical protein